ncbi:MAG TPA: AAA family ATPase [Bryobacteraceae bacterium]|nr:AAA family ATPase [Bryobacteraceae bacterium]
MTLAPVEKSWIECNQQLMAGHFARLKRTLSREVADFEPIEPLEPPAAIEMVEKLFGLTPFERDVLLLCAGVEMDSELAALCGEAQGSSHAGATFGLALGALAEPHWTALAPDRPLRRYRLIEMDARRGLTSAPLRIDERVLHFLAGDNALDTGLEGILNLVPAPQQIAAGHELVAIRMAEALERGCVLHLCGDDALGQEDAAALASQTWGLRLFRIRAEDLPAGPELDRFAALWEREALLLDAALLVQCASAEVTTAARRLAAKLPGAVFIASREPARFDRACLRFDIDKPAPAEQKRLWQCAVAESLGFCDELAGLMAQQFRLSARTIAETGALVSDKVGAGADEIWDACRAMARPRLEDLAQRVTPAATWEDLVLPEAQTATLRLMAAQARHRMQVYEDWGFAGKGRRGLGIHALFAGESGTGKTLAAEVLARELTLDLYRVDLAAVVSKYIGETSKNMRQVFDAAEEGGVLLLFDEADALFGKRSDVKDSHDRYANIDVGYLLQRMETYQGISVMTTNMRSAVDRAFQRRLRFMVNFPFPNSAQREAIWRRAFPPDTPTSELDHGKLARLNVAGGNIRNIALNAAFIAAEAKTAVTMAHLLSAARLEAQKIDRGLSEAEIRGWV